MEALMNQLSDLWCSLMHESPMWPIHGHYRCRTCGREYPVEWGIEAAAFSSQPIRTLRFADASK
jgi:hypothetical protein